MFEAFISIVTVIALIPPQLTTCSATEVIGKDGFNFYKDYLRGRADEVPDLTPVISDRLLYFYRTPMQLHSDMPAVVLDQDYRKRTTNAFKNHMLSKDSWAYGEGRTTKRSSKTALSLILAGRQNLYQTYVTPADANFNLLYT